MSRGCYRPRVGRGEPRASARGALAAHRRRPGVRHPRQLLLASSSPACCSGRGACVGHRRRGAGRGLRDADAPGRAPSGGGAGAGRHLLGAAWVAQARTASLEHTRAGGELRAVRGGRGDAARRRCAPTPTAAGARWCAGAASRCCCGCRAGWCRAPGPGGLISVARRAVTLPSTRSASATSSPCADACGRRTSPARRSTPTPAACHRAGADRPPTRRRPRRRRRRAPARRARS